MWDVDVRNDPIRKKDILVISLVSFIDENSGYACIIRGITRQFRGCGTRHILVDTIIATNIQSFNGGCSTAKSVAVLPCPGYASAHNVYHLEMCNIAHLSHTIAVIPIPTKWILIG